MSDERLPTDDQLRRIERGVMDRIDARRALRTRVIGSVTAVVLVGGGFGLLAGVLHGTSSGAASTSDGAAGSAASSAESVVVRCALGAGSDASGAQRVRVVRAALPQSAVAACTGAGADFQSGQGRIPKNGPDETAAPEAGAASGAASSAASPSALPTGVLCTDVDGSLVVLSLKGTASATCVQAGMEPFER